MQISDLIGKKFHTVEARNNNEELVFIGDEGSYRFYHYQDCCENVSIDDINGELADLVGTPILQADEEVSNENPEGVAPEYQYSFTWTFYRFGTIKGRVVVRWYGESNGYYSESVDFAEIK